MSGVLRNQVAQFSSELAMELSFDPSGILSESDIAVLQTAVTNMNTALNYFIGTTFVNFGNTVAGEFTAVYNDYDPKHTAIMEDIADIYERLGDTGSGPSIKDLIDELMGLLDALGSIAALVEAGGTLAEIAAGAGLLATVAVGALAGSLLSSALIGGALGSSSTAVATTLTTMKTTIDSFSTVLADIATLQGQVTALQGTGYVASTSNTNVALATAVAWLNANVVTMSNTTYTAMQTAIANLQGAGYVASVSNTNTALATAVSFLNTNMLTTASTPFTNLQTAIVNLQGSGYSPTTHNTNTALYAYIIAIQGTGYFTTSSNSIVAMAADIQTLYANSLTVYSPTITNLQGVGYTHTSSNTNMAMAANIATLQSTAITTSSTAYTNLLAADLSNANAIGVLQGSGYHYTGSNDAMTMGANIGTLQAQMANVISTDEPNIATLQGQMTTLQGTGYTATSSNNNMALAASVASLVSSAANSPPVGSIMIWMTSTIPSNYLLCNGQSFSATSYPALHTVFPGNVVPDLRGYFLRGYDATGTVDPAGATRTLGTTIQADDTAAHTHTFTQAQVSAVAASGKILNTISDATANYATANSSSIGAAASIGLSSGGSETRPKNIAVNYIIRAI